MSERRPGPTARVRVHEWRSDDQLPREDRLATEEPLELRMAWPGSPARRFTVTMRTPGADFALAVGLAYAERLLACADDLAGVAYCTDEQLAPAQLYNVVTLQLRRPPARWPERSLASTSACGVCGAQSLDDVLRDVPAPSAAAKPVSVARLRALPQRLRRGQRLFEATGGVHAAGAFAAGTGELLVAAEDVGRHNAVDKVVGQALMDGLSLTGAILCVSGRVGFEIVTKAAVAGIPVLVAVGAPTSLAVSLAAQAGITVAGFVRGDRLVAYSHADRLE